MIAPFNEIAPPFQRAALDAGSVGTWELDVENDRFRCDEVAASFYRITAEESVAGVPIARTAAVIHPDDLALWRGRRAASLANGGVFVIEYRVVSPGNQTRWLLVRGRYDLGADGRVVQGRGIVIDVSDSKRDGYAEGQASMLGPALIDRDSAIERAAAHALAAHRELSRLARGVDRALLVVADQLLQELGLAIARRQGPVHVPETRH